MDGYRVERKHLISLVRCREYDVVNAHWTYVYAHAALKADSNALISVHDDVLALFRLKRSPGLATLVLMARHTARKARNVTVVSPHIIRNWVTELRGVEPIRVVPNMTPFPSAQAVTVRSKWVASLGHAHANKNLSALLKAWMSIAHMRGDWELHLAGPGLEEGCQLARGAGSDHSIRFRGPLDRLQVEELLRHSSFLAHPSLSEGCPLAVIEALSFGLPILGHRGAGPIEWMAGPAANLVDCRNEGEIARALCRWIENADQLRQLQVQAFNAATKFDASAVVEGYLHAYHEALTRN